ncbi:MAG: L-threonylcarbamoyladenylate synthase [Candidatus Altiarchaeota archaeon]|nr:L-threonylcarbamoyladenylate synthase [Candidatus Altiarchaeota archaeon]
MDELMMKAVEAIWRGGVVIAPTDSVYGLFGDALNNEAVERIRALKGRDGGKPFQIAVEKKDAEVYGIINETAERIIKAYWPGDVNVIVVKKPAVPDFVSTGTVCLTCHRNPVARSLVELTGKPLVSTSVNASGMPPAVSAAGIDREILGRVDIVLDGGETKNKVPNTIVDTTVTPAKIVREGVVGLDSLLPLL